MNDPRYDGYVQWGRKQDLYRIKFKLDELIAAGPKFAPEEEWLEEQDRERMFNILKK